MQGPTYLTLVWWLFVPIVTSHFPLQMCLLTLTPPVCRDTVSRGKQVESPPRGYSCLCPFAKHEALQSWACMHKKTAYTVTPTHGALSRYSQGHCSSCDLVNMECPLVLLCESSLEKMRPYKQSTFVAKRSLGIMAGDGIKTH